jgi:hypothetical protein
MKPVHTERSNFTYVGPTPDIGDLHCRVNRDPDATEIRSYSPVESVWWLTPDEREAIANGANIMLTVQQEPLPPVRLEVTTVQGDGEDAPEVLERLHTYDPSKS